jgi:hypothetical protein
MGPKQDNRGAYLPAMFERGIYWSADTFRPDLAQTKFERMKVEFDIGTAAVSGEAVSHPSGGAYLRLVRTNKWNCIIKWKQPPDSWYNNQLETRFGYRG